MTREERIALNAAKTRATFYKFMVLAITCVLVASYRYYFYSYLGNDAYLYISYALAFIGWLILFCAAYLKYLSPANKNKLVWQKQIGALLTLVLLSAAYPMAISELTEQRISRILDTGPTQLTAATVVDIQQKRSRYTGGTYARYVITYQVDGKTYQKAIVAAWGDYKAVETYTLKYSVDYPGMFELYNKKYIPYLNGR